MARRRFLVREIFLPVDTYGGGANISVSAVLDKSEKCQ
jgi:hypothetical protein